MNKGYNFNIVISSDEVTALSLKVEIEKKYPGKIITIKDKKASLNEEVLETADIIIIDYEFQTKVIGYLMKNKLDIPVICIIPEEKKGHFPRCIEELKICCVVKDKDFLINLENCLRHHLQFKESERRVKEADSEEKCCNQ